MRTIALVVAGLSLCAPTHSAAADVPAGMLEKVDAHVASTMRDPLSAIQYQVSGLLACSALADFEEGHHCACFSVNGRNGLGGYAGAQLSAVMVVVDTEGPRRAIGVLSFPFQIGPEGAIACAKAGMMKRDSAFIHKAAE